jgi:hypothetical protein
MSDPRTAPYEMATDEMERAVVDVRVPGVDLGQGVHAARTLTSVVLDAFG